MRPLNRPRARLRRSLTLYEFGEDIVLADGWTASPSATGGPCGLALVDGVSVCGFGRLVREDGVGEASIIAEEGGLPEVLRPTWFRNGVGFADGAAIGAKPQALAVYADPDGWMGIDDSDIFDDDNLGFTIIMESFQYALL